MAESSSEADTFPDTSRSRRCSSARPPPPRVRQQRRLPRASEHLDLDGDLGGNIGERMETLTSTLQDTSRNLHSVDRMLAQYREHTEGQAEDMAALRDDLEKSIEQLQSQRLRRGSAAHSPFTSTPHTNELGDGLRYLPTSPLHDYNGSETKIQRRSQSASVRFRDPGEKGLHNLHQSLRDLRSDQLRLGNEVDREISRRNRAELETRRTLENFSEHMRASQRESVSSQVERRLQEVEKQMRSYRQALERCPDPRANVSAELQEVLRTREPRVSEAEEAMKNRLLQSERDKNKMELELEKARRQLDQSEGGRDALLQQVENLRLQLVRTEKERADMQQQISHLLSQQRSHSDQLNWPRGLGSVERGAQTLQVQRGPPGEVEELRRAVECKERERAQLSARVEVLSSELERHEQQQLQMLAQLKELQTRFEEERTQAGQNLAQAERSREEGDQRREKLRARAQEALRQWKSRCKALERDLEEKDRELQRSADDAQQASKDKESLQAQLRVLGQQAEGLRRELEEALGRLAQREEELRRRDEELGESQARRKTLEQEVREVSRALQVESERRRLLETQLREENRNLEARADALVHCHEEDQVALLELQGTVKELSTARAGLATRLAEEERAGRQRLEEAQRECISLGQQLQLARELHEKELSSMRAGLQESKARHEENTQLYQQEKEELEAQLEDLKTEAAADRELACAHQRQLERMKAECERLAEEQARSEESHAHLRRKYQLLKQEVEEKAKVVARGDGYLRAMDDVVTELREQVGRLEAERQSVLGSAGAEINTLCRLLSGDSNDKFKVVALTPGIHKDPNRWLAEIKTKLQWLCEEVKERGNREEKLRQHLQQGREQLKVLRKSKDGEQKLLLERLAQQEQLLEDIHGEKRELLERMRRKDEDMQSLQDRILDLETRTKVALEHLESVPEKLSLLENFKDLEECQRQREMVEQRYAKYREIVGVLQHELEESKRRIQEYRNDKLDATSRSLRLATLSSSIRDQGSFLSSTLLTSMGSTQMSLLSRFSQRA
ncbi:centrosomal protein of 128 kDa isoform X2 [Scleropages formosus]|uniref:centrosomal protein of 128 kDa isoform X2 n=1 Tax=Scleropages formosus TaxID=113540 RepID=UPI000877EA64|nr:centrosomal protein of 128 kDa isoform X2 [Scleropages formosus]